MAEETNDLTGADIIKASGEGLGYKPFSSNNPNNDLVDTRFMVKPADSDYMSVYNDVANTNPMDLVPSFTKPNFKSPTLSGGESENFFNTRNQLEHGVPMVYSDKNHGHLL
jgi:hypothetical protein